MAETVVIGQDRLGSADAAPPKAGLRERKKQRTRQALVAAALRLFEEKGYERTTVAEIAAAADVSTKTLFNYFPSKEEMIFSEHRTRLALVLDTMAKREPGEPPTALLARVADQLLASVVAADAATDLQTGPLRLRLIMTVPELQARAWRLLFDVQRQWADALHRAYPDVIEPATAAAAVGALVGAAHGSAVASIRRGDPTEDMLKVMRSAMELTLRGVRSLDGRTTPTS